MEEESEGYWRQSWCHKKGKELLKKKGWDMGSLWPRLQHTTPSITVIINPAISLLGISGPGVKCKFNRYKTFTESSL